MKHAPPPAVAEGGLVKLAVLAVGGQGGGVLTGWITALAEAQGCWAQATSVAGVAQRTGATIYYVEMAPKDPSRPDRAPVFALSPAPGDVDILIAAELAEAGRAVLRGFVTERTTLIASTHRLLAVAEKIAPGDGRADAGPVLAHAAAAAGRLVAFDMDAIAGAAGAHVSASLFGALAGSGALPFPRDAFEATIRADGRAVAPSLAAFAAACDRAREGARARDGDGDRDDDRDRHGDRDDAAEATGGNDGPASAAPPPGAPAAVAGGAEAAAGGRAGAAASAPPAPAPAAAPAPAPTPAAAVGPARLVAEWRALEARAAAYPGPVAAMAAHGLRKVTDYLDTAYGGEYLDRLDRAVAAEAGAPGPGGAHGRADGGHAFATAAAKHLANAMAYDDLPRVADLKTRAARGARLRAEAGAAAADRLTTTEYLHPRMAEVAATLPAALGGWLAARPRLMAALDRVVDRGRRLRSDRITGFAALWLVAALRPRRRSLLRHRAETAHLDAWFDRALAALASDHPLAVEILNARRLIKGYSDTHARGRSKYDRVLAALPLIEGRPDAADWLRRLIAAAMQDPDGHALDGALRTIASFAPPPGDAPTPPRPTR